MTNALKKEELPGIFCVLTDLEETICSRRNSPPDGSYTAKLFARGIPRIAQKVGEEGVELALAAVSKSPTVPEEAADLIYHMLVLLEACGSSLTEVLTVLDRRALVRRPGFDQKPSPST